MSRSKSYGKRLSAAVVLAGLTSLAQPGLSQDEDSAFLACAEFSDRGQRIACLEDALEAAAGGEDDPADKAEARAPAQEASARTGDGGASQSAPTSSRSVDVDRQRLDNYGRDTARVETNEGGDEELHDTVSELVPAKPNQWRIKLSSGQVWRQVHPRRYNLRKGDEVRIYPTQWGDNFRLETEGLSGFIQVLRIE